MKKLLPIIGFAIALFCFYIYEKGLPELSSFRVQSSIFPASIRELAQQGLNGDGSAAQQVAMAYKNGVEVPNDIKKMFAWLNIAESLGFNDEKEIHEWFSELSEGDQMKLYAASEDYKQLRRLSEGVLGKIQISDVPEYYKESDALTSRYTVPLTRKSPYTMTFSNGYQQTGYYEFAHLIPSECDQFRTAAPATADDDPYYSCISDLAFYLGDPSLCTYVKTAPLNQNFGACIISTNKKINKGGAKHCFLIERPNDLYADDSVEILGSFTLCIWEVIAANPTEAGCELLSKTLEGVQRLNSECLSELELTSSLSL